MEEKEIKKEEVEVYNSDNFVEKGDSGEEEIFDIDVRTCKFATYGGDFIVRQLMEMMKEGEIETPKIQRHYVWTNKIASRFIESILLDLPLPSIFLAKGEDGKFIVIDGLQRLTTLYKYIIDGVKDGKTFKLSISKDIREEWRGKAFNELDVEDQRRIKNKLLHAIIVEQKEPANFNGLFLIFERINTGGLQLNQQEIRNAIFQYPINELINDINNNKVWRNMFGSEVPHSRMRDNEMILRFLTLENLNLIDSKVDSLNMVALLNDFLKDNRYASETKLEAIKKRFLSTLLIVNKLFGDKVFRTNIQNMQVSQRFYATTFDALMLSTAYAAAQGYNFDGLKDCGKRLEALFGDVEFRNACSVHTTDANAVKTRISKALEKLYGIAYERKL